MDFSRLPYELQFDYLLKLPYRDVLSYCQSNRAAHEICLTEQFWNRKSLQDFKIPINLIPGENPVQRYVQIEELSTEPRDLIMLLARKGYFPPLPELFQSIQAVRFIRTPRHIMIEFDPIISQAFIEAIRYNQADLLRELISYFARPFMGTKFVDSTKFFLRTPFIETIVQRRPQLEAIIREFYDPETDDPEEFVQYYLEAIEKGQLDLVKYLAPLVKDNVPSYEAVELAIRTHDPEMIEYVTGVFPQMFQLPEDVNEMLEDFIYRNDPLGVQEIVRIYRPIIDFESARRGTPTDHRRALLQYLV